MALFLFFKHGGSEKAEDAWVFFEIYIYIYILMDPVEVRSIRHYHQGARKAQTKKREAL